MKISISNLGVIKKAEIDLKPLTILVGENNTGKTWLAYTLAGSLGNYGWSRYTTAYVAGKTPTKYRKLDNIVKQITSSGEGVLDIVAFADEYGEKCINDILQFSKTWMHKYLSTDRVKFDTLELKADIASIKDHIINYLQLITIDTNNHHSENPVLRALKEPGERKLFFFPSSDIAERRPTKAVKEFVFGIVFQTLLQAFFPEIYTFPTERASIINDTFLALPTRSFVESIVGERVLPASDEIKSILSSIRPQSWPVSSFATMIARLYISGNISDRTEKAIEEHAIEQYMQLADVLQENILEGNLDFSTPVPNSRREILFKPDECIDTETQELEVSITSSMIKELSSLVLYLRYEAKHGELLVIDEPEMNLHPAAQVKIIEFLAMLVNAGLHVLITTHSTYVIDHLVNLMDAYKHQNQDELVDIFLLQSKEAFIDQDKVSVYHIANGEAKNILDAEGIIDWQTFSDVTRLVQRIHYEL